MGVDPGSRKTGFGVINGESNNPRYLASGTIRLEKYIGVQRLKELFNAMDSLLTQFQPDLVAIEKIFMHHNANSALVLGQARGVILCAAALREKAIQEYSATRIKQAVVGHGHATKHEVSHMVCKTLGLNSVPGEDAADALACAMCHQRTVRFGIAP